MDYKRIYAEFIKDRREKEPLLSGYVERHHILPRSLGGGNESENLIRLTAEDHFFAHLCLAKIHGGKMWAPVAFMIGGQRKDYRPVVSRKYYGWAARAMAKACSGEGAHQFDWRQYSLLHLDGRAWVGRQSDMTELGISRSLANMLIKGRLKSAKGWYFAHQPRPERLKGSSHPMYRARKTTFRHVDGRVFVGTQHELHLAHGLSKSMACRLARGDFRCAKGWYVEGKPPIAKTGKGAKYTGQLALSASD